MYDFAEKLKDWGPFGTRYGTYLTVHHSRATPSPATAAPASSSTAAQPDSLLPAPTSTTALVAHSSAKSQQTAPDNDTSSELSDIDATDLASLEAELTGLPPSTSPKPPFSLALSDTESITIYKKPLRTPSPPQYLAYLQHNNAHVLFICNTSDELSFGGFELWGMNEEARRRIGDGGEVSIWRIWEGDVVDDGGRGFLEWRMGDERGVAKWTGFVEGWEQGLSAGERERLVCARGLEM